MKCSTTPQRIEGFHEVCMGFYGMEDVPEDSGVCTCKTAYMKLA